MASRQQAELERVFGVPARLRIMAALMVRGQMDFTAVIELLNLTRGNLSMHMKTLQEGGCVEIRKSFAGNKPRTTYHITGKGRQDFGAYAAYLEHIIASVKS